MSTRSLRHRSSRYSSPAAFGEKEPPPKSIVVETQAQAHLHPTTRIGQQTSLDKWVEPNVRTAVPSFEDTKGLERVGVLENMQPLGVPPSHRLLQKLKLNYTRPSPRATPAQTEEVVTPLPEQEKSDLASPLEPEMLREVSPEPPRHSDTIVITSPPRGRPSRREVAEMSQASNVSPSGVRLSFTPGTHSKPASIQEHLRQDRLNNHLELALQEAQDKGTPNLIPGLERLREDAQLIPELYNVIEAVIQQSPTHKQFRTFKRYIKSGVKDFRRASQSQVSDGSHRPSSFAEINSAFASPQQADLNRTTHRRVTSTGFTDEGNRRIALFFGQTRKEPTRAPYSQDMANSSLAASALPNLDPALVGAGPVPVASPHKRKRSLSPASDSSLSSAQSIPDDFVSNAQQNDQTAIGRSRSMGQRQATHRAGNRLRSAGSGITHQSLPKQSDTQQASKSTTKKFKKNQGGPEFDIDELSRRKRHYLDDSFHDYNTIPRPESDERDITHGHPEPAYSLTENPPPPVIHPNRLISTNAALSSPISSHAPRDTMLANGNGRKRAYDELDADDLELGSSLSPSPLLVPPPPPGLANTTSRGATPRGSRFPPTTRTRKSARVMVSPNKPKNGGVTAGISRAGAGRDGRVGEGADSSAEDNDEFCASCGGEGKLLCCDGCTNSFHHNCLEPPLNPDEEVDGEWYCPQCVARQTKGVPHPSGLLGWVVRRVDDTIPKAFALPHDVRQYFEGVRTGDEGEYEEFGQPRTQNNALKMNRAGFFEEPNYKETRDSKGNLRLCYRCGLTTNGRDIIPCDFCPAKWHLDCTDPPLAVPPRRRGDDKPSSSWRCPLHTEHDLAAISRQVEAAPGALGRIPKLRKPRNAVPLDVEFARGHRNNGIIDVELMPDEFSFDKTKEVRMEGKIYRIPEKAIRLDFIDRVKRSWYEDHSFPQQLGGPKIIRSKKYRPDGVVLHHPPEVTLIRTQEPEFWSGTHALAVTETARANALLRNRSIREQQAVLNLAEMSQKGIDGYSGDALAELTNQLVSEAPPEVTELAEQDEVDKLLHLQELINRRLTLLNHGSTSASSASPRGSVVSANGAVSPKTKPIVSSTDEPYVNGDTPKSYASGHEADNEMHQSP